MRLRHFMIAVAKLVVIVIFAACVTHSAKRRAESMSCGNYMCSIVIGARAWAMDSDDYLPSDFLSMSNELATPRILVCPGDHSRHPAPDWASVTPDNSSYEIVAPRLRDGDSNEVFLRCKFHHDHRGYADGTVFDGIKRRTKVR